MPDPTPIAARPVRLHNYLAYGSNDVLGAGSMAVISGWVLIFYTQFCGLSAGQAATIFAVARILDAFASPMIGYISDHFGGTWLGQRFGRRRFFILAAIPLLPSFALMWLPGQGFWYYLVSYVLFELVYAMEIIPFETLAAEMSSDYRTKAKFAGSRILFGQASAILAGFLPLWLIEALGRVREVANQASRSVRETFDSVVGEAVGSLERASGDAIRIANSGTGSGTHLGALSMMNAVGCEAVHLPIGTRRRNATVLSGEADAMVAPLTGALNLVRADRLRLLATLSMERNEVIPDVPTATELGFDVRFELFRGLSVPKNTPPEIKRQLADTMSRAAMSEAFMGLADEVGFTVDPMPTERFEALMATEDATVKSILETAGLAPNAD